MQLIDLRMLEQFQPGYIIEFKYYDVVYDHRRTRGLIHEFWSIEQTYRDSVLCSKVCESGAIIKEYFNINTLIERGVLNEEKVL